MNSPLVKTAKTDGSQTAFVFELPLSKERDSFLQSPTSTLTRMMVSTRVLIEARRSEKLIIVLRVAFSL